MECYSSESSGSGSETEASLAVKTLDYSYLMLNDAALYSHIEEVKDGEKKRGETVQRLLAYNNQLTEVPCNISVFHNLRHIDVSNNRLTCLPPFLAKCPLGVLIAKNNQIDNSGLPVSFASWINTLTTVNLSGNRLTTFPHQVLNLAKIKYLYLGSNRIREVPRSIDRIITLSALCLGGNRLVEVPESMGRLRGLEVLVLSDNHLESLPPTIASLDRLKTLQLHNNRLRTLPTQIITLSCLSQLSLRDNPLVVKFVDEMTHDPGSLLELCARLIKQAQISYSPVDLPLSLQTYLDSAHHCVNPRCNGVFFDNHVEHIKFVDFCGKYRVPLLQYLCSSKCMMENSPREEAGPSRPHNDTMMRKVLLG